ncbi:SDR family NAD(P)-dependent oxidoreductase [Lutibacter flavus]|uniref:NAD(P)-dependent dehydrogenase, short-chain alcohol dehydrogenase family n=1 Tax=Lutibacter flavus TaxID=691689 RepID=A0A238VTC0_9FLAO|nr:SDR family oxidoreductase [Lutibacter flavus]SNR37431.1 NAD(P)-dependent dehydrogenase, short-chain alcohol dehydrogenase family [Lutibacter flavus]
MKTIVIIGGSKGIGGAILKNQLNTHKVVNISRTKPTISHENLTHYSCDVLVDELPDLSELDSLIYCPGSINLKPFSRLKIEEFQSDFEINVLGAIKAIQKYLPQLKKKNGATILLFSTVATKLGMPFHTSIASAKSAVEGLVKSLGAELAPKIRINAIAPTITNTTLAEKILRNDAMKEAIAERHPLKKYLIPQEVADMADFLISEKSGSMSGQIISLDCGIVTFKS